MDPGLKGLEEEEGCALGEFDQGTLTTKQRRSSNEVWKVCTLGFWAKVYSTRQENCLPNGRPASSEQRSPTSIRTSEVFIEIC